MDLRALIDAQLQRAWQERLQRSYHGHDVRRLGPNNWLAQEIGVDRGTVTRYLTGKREIAAEALRKMFVAMKIDLRQPFGRGWGYFQFRHHYWKTALNVHRMPTMRHLLLTCMERKRWTYLHLAKASGTPVTTIWKYVQTEGRDITTKTLPKLLIALEIEVGRCDHQFGGALVWRSF